MEAQNRQFLNFSALSKYRSAIYGMSALWIIAFHGIELEFTSIDSKMVAFEELLRMGNIGVDIFLVLSGISLFYAFSKDGHVLKFYYKRLVRILIPFLIIAGIYLAYLNFIRTQNVTAFFLNLSTIAYWIGFRQGVSFWYVPTILVLYILYPLIHMFIYMRKNGKLIRCIVLMAAAIGISILLYYVIPAGAPTRDFYMISIPRFAIFIFGCYFGHIVKEERNIPAWLIVVAMLVVFAAFPLYSETVFRGLFYRYYGSLTGFMLAVLMSQFAVLISSIKLDKFFGFFGNISLEIYIAHIALRNLLMRTGYYNENHIWLKYLIVFAAATLIAWVVSLITKPICRALNKIVEK